MDTEKSKSRRRSGDGQKPAESTGSTVHVTFRIPAELHARLTKEAQARAEDFSTTARRRLALGVTRDDADSRLEEITGKLDMLMAAVGKSASGDTPERLDALTSAALEMESRLAQVVVGQKAAHVDFEALTDAYNDIVNTLNAFFDKMRR